MHVHHIGEQNSLINRFISELRDVSVQKDRMRFRRNIERIGEILAYELSKKLHYTTKEINSPLGKVNIQLPEEEIVVCSILRAGIPLHTGLLNYFDHAESSFISAYRHHPDNDHNFEIIVEYLASPSLENKTLILCDPMLATGRSFLNVMKALQPLGTPKNLHLVAIIGARDGINNLAGDLPEESNLWIAAIDEHLDEWGYIVPGLGDAGDLAFGPKQQG